MSGHSTLRCSRCRRVSASVTGHPDNVGMSLMGHLRRFDRALLTSGLPLLADIFQSPSPCLKGARNGLTRRVIHDLGHETSRARCETVQANALAEAASIRSIMFGSWNRS